MDMTNIYQEQRRPRQNKSMIEIVRKRKTTENIYIGKESKKYSGIHYTSFGELHITCYQEKIRNNPCLFTVINWGCCNAFVISGVKATGVAMYTLISYLFIYYHSLSL